MNRRLAFVMCCLFGVAAGVAVGCENTSPIRHHIPGPEDYVVAEGWDSLTIATVDTYRLRARRLRPCAPLPEAGANWVKHSLPGLPGSTLRVPPELAESIDTLPDSSISSLFGDNKKAWIEVIFSPHGDDSPGTIPRGCATRIAGYETPLDLHDSSAIDGRFSAHVTFALPDSFGVSIDLAARSKTARDSLLGVLRSLSVPSSAARHAVPHVQRR